MEWINGVCRVGPEMKKRKRMKRGGEKERRSQSVLEQGQRSDNLKKYLTIKTKTRESRLSLQSYLKMDLIFQISDHDVTDLHKFDEADFGSKRRPFDLCSATSL